MRGTRDIPLLFHVMMQALGHVSRSWWAVAALHVIIATFAAWLVLRYAPFTRVQKVLLVFGYWMAYEYAVVVRPYGLGMMLAFAACIAWTALRRRTGWTALCLVLLANTTPMGTLLAMTLALGFAVDWAWPDAGRPRPSRRAVLAGGFARARSRRSRCSVVAAVQMKPPADAAYKGQPRVSVSAGISKWDIAAIPTDGAQGARAGACMRAATACSGITGCCGRSRGARSPRCSSPRSRRSRSGPSSPRAGAWRCSSSSSARRATCSSSALSSPAQRTITAICSSCGSSARGWRGAEHPAAGRIVLQRLSEHFEPDRSRILTLSLVLPVVATVESRGGRSRRSLRRRTSRRRHHPVARAGERDDRRCRALRGAGGRGVSRPARALSARGEAAHLRRLGWRLALSADGAGGRQRRDADPHA